MCRFQGLHVQAHVVIRLPKNGGEGVTRDEVMKPPF